MTESAENIEPGTDTGKKITIVKNGPYIVEGHVRLVRKTQVVSENGEPLTWQTGETLATRERCRLCRCGQSSNKPFCDATHVRLEFVGAESERAFDNNRVTLTGGAHITVRRDYSLCMEAGFCATRFANIEKMLAESEDSRVRSQIIAMIERCPSGSFTYTLDAGAAGVDIEPDLPAQVAVTRRQGTTNLRWPTARPTTRWPTPGTRSVTGSPTPASYRCGLASR